MNKRVLVAIVTLVSVIGIVVGVYAITKSAPSHTEPSALSNAAWTSKRVSQPGPLTSSGLAPATGFYIDYGPTAIKNAVGRTFLFFYASWCGQCHEIDGGILKEGVPAGNTIIKVNWDTEQALEQKYGVAMRTTFVELDKNGNGVKKFVAYDTPTFDAVINAMF